MDRAWSPPGGPRSMSGGRVAAVSALRASTRPASRRSHHLRRAAASKGGVMFRKDPRALLLGAVVASVVAGVFAAPAMGCSTTTAGAGCATTITGTALGQLSLSVATPAAMVLVPGDTSYTTNNTTTSAVTAIDTSS